MQREATPTTQTSFFSLWVSPKTNLLPLLHRLSLPLFPTDVIFFFVLLQKHSCLNNSLQHEERGEEIKTLLRVERYLMFQSGSEGGFSSLKMPVTGRLGKHVRWLIWGRRLEWSRAGVQGARTLCSSINVSLIPQVGLSAAGNLLERRVSSLVVSHQSNHKEFY